ncbi:MAG: hypothetical protein EOO59_20910, partial [Hymenobacter sp.]
MRIRVSGRWPLIGWLSLLPLALAAQAAGPVPRAAAPGRYWVSFADKAGVAFDPAAYFSPAARARRQRQGLPAYEATDLPVRPDYLGRLRAGSDTITLVSRWFNAAACRATPAQAVALRQLPGVVRVVPWPETAAPAALAARPTAATPPLGRRNEVSANDYLLARQQTAV